MNIQLKILNGKFYSQESNGVLLNPLPSYATWGSAALDLVCTEDVNICAGEQEVIHTGIAIWIGCPTKNGGSRMVDYAGLILPRSGLGTRGLVLSNTVGLIDSDYQGELLVNVWNRNLPDRNSISNASAFTGGRECMKNTITLRAGDRFAQLVLIPVEQAEWTVVKEFTSTTERSDGAFGSSGK